jgi:hypothetical protein
MVISLAMDEPVPVAQKLKSKKLIIRTTEEAQVVDGAMRSANRGDFDRLSRSDSPPVL